MNALALLVDNGINGDRSLTSLTVTDDQLTLATTDRDHGINCLNTGLQRGIYGFSLDNAVSHTLDPAELVSLDRALAIDWLA